MTGKYADHLNPVHVTQDTCRGCGQSDLRRFLSLGPQPLANAFLSNEDEFGSEQFFPLDVYFCNRCSLVQLLDIIDPSLLFRDYIYVTGTSDTIAAHNREYAKTVIDLLRLSNRDLVVEIASNDGSLLKQFKALGVKTLGIEPAVNIAQLARDSGIETVPEFFDSRLAEDLAENHGLANAVICNNVLAHVNDPGDFLAGGKRLLNGSGLMIIEVPYLGELLGRLEYDTVYHEHICYFSITALLHLCERAGLSIVRVDHVPVHGGSIRVYAGSREYYPHHANDVLSEATAEKATGLSDYSGYIDFANDVESNRDALLALLKDIKEQGKSIVGYGAPAKGNTLLNFCKIGTDLLPYTVDRSPHKVDLLTPGMHIPVLPVKTLLEKQPDYVLILAWNFAEEILRQQEEYRKRGGQFIVPIPVPRMVGSD
jgi:hypothetical protein